MLSLTHIFRLFLFLTFFCCRLFVWLAAVGHRSDKCPAKAAEKSEEMCVFCGKPGHKLADCPTGDPVREMECFFCGEKNHTYYQCPKRKEFLTKSEDGEREFESYVVCRNCGRVGHFESKCDQPSQRKTVCFHCGQTGHTSKECPNPKESAEALRVCRHCGELGHFATECPEPSVARPAKCPLCGGFGHKLEDCPRDMPAEKPKEEAKPKAAPKPAPKPKAKPLTPSDLNSTEQFPSL